MRVVSIMRNAQITFYWARTKKNEVACRGAHYYTFFAHQDPVQPQQHYDEYRRHDNLPQALRTTCTFFGHTPSLPIYELSQGIPLKTGKIGGVLASPRHEQQARKGPEQEHPLYWTLFSEDDIPLQYTVCNTRES